MYTQRDTHEKNSPGNLRIRGKTEGYFREACCFPDNSETDSGPEFVFIS